MSSYRSNVSRHNWTEEETHFFLQTLKAMNIGHYTDGRKNRNSLIFRKVCAKHREAGFARSCDQVKHRWKALKSIYYKAKKQNPCNSNGGFRFFDAMEEIFAQRHMALTNHVEVDVDLKESSPLSESKCFIFEDADSNVKKENDPIGLTQASNESFSSSESSKPPQPVTSTESIKLTPSSTAPEPLMQGMFHHKRPCCAALHSQYQDFLERMQHAQNTWLERQLEQNHAREERLIARVLTEHTRSMETIVNQLFAGLRSLLPTQTIPNPLPVPTVPDIFSSLPLAEHWQSVSQPGSALRAHPEQHSTGHI
ncbi:hypothetical protein DNTS_028731 [Danionella cerebrum]|uniref:Myb/SANT-like DNA-binding domain-containing protein n=1 Tax=Danionella cerebrum TaxID=2873325 RepID=A0A553R9I4_9TELE|nr:hypothetical protein DNTS_028731 [Danionella translucida]